MKKQMCFKGLKVRNGQNDLFHAISIGVEYASLDRDACNLNKALKCETQLENADDSAIDENSNYFNNKITNNSNNEDATMHNDRELN